MNSIEANVEVRWSEMIIAESRSIIPFTYWSASYYL
jgi:hypothetical protein